MYLTSVEIKTTGARRVEHVPSTLTTKIRNSHAY